MQENKITDQEIQTIKEKMFTQDSLDKLASFYSLFSDPTRLSLICLLSDHELCVNDIVQILGMSQSRVSHQLAILRNHDIVKYSRKGKQILYTVTDNHIKDLFKTGIEHISEKDDEVYQDRKKTGMLILREPDSGSLFIKTNTFDKDKTQRQVEKNSSR